MPQWTPKPLLVSVASQQEQIDLAFADAHKYLLATFPDAQVAHVGSTALADILSRGVVDIDMAVSADQVEQTKRALAEQPLAETYLKLNIQVRDRAAANTALQVRQCMAENPLLRGEYKGLQKQFAHRIGKAYPQAKKRFFDDLVQGSAFAQASKTPLPYQIQLQSERLELHSAAIGDAAEFVAYQLANRANFESSAGTRPNSHYALSKWQTRFADEALLRWRKEKLTFLLRTKSTGQLIGAIHFSGFVWGAFRSCDIGYQIDKSFEGQGYMFEACNAAIEHLRSDWQVHRIQSVYGASNERSAHLAKRMGMRVMGTAKDYICIDGCWQDGEIAELLP